jgi:hypothetical protein
MRSFPIALAAVLLTAPALGAQAAARPGVPVPDVPARPEDVATLDGIIAAF